MSNQTKRAHLPTLSRRALLAGAAMMMTMPTGDAAAARTPVPIGENAFATRIGNLFAASPARDFAGGTSVPFYFADLAGQLASVGVERPDPGEVASTLPDGFFEGTIALPLASRAFDMAQSPEWFPTFGFNPYAVAQAFLLASPPDVVSIFAGGFDRETVEAALEASGYATVRQETGDPYYSVGGDVALDTPAGQLGLGTMNHAVVRDDLLVFAQRESDLQTVTAVLVGVEPAMAGQALWGDMVSFFSPDTVGLIPVAPAFLTDRAVSASPVATAVTGRTALRYLAFGVRAGSRAEPISLVGEGTPQAIPVGDADAVPAYVEARLAYADADTAQREAGEIPQRWREMRSIITGQVYESLMPIERAGISPVDPAVVAIDFVTLPPNRWSQMIHTGDLAPLLPVRG